MGILRVDHPDVRDFIALKTDQHELNNFNVSVAVTDEYMQKVRDGDREARKLWSLIFNAAWKHGDPGLFFVDRANEDNPLLPEYPIRATNPCGEIPMPDNDACNLGSINLGNFVVDGVFQGSRFSETVSLAIRFLDDVVSVNKVPVKAIEKFTKQTRRLGLGVMGWADFLNKMEIPYDSEQAIFWANTIGNTLRSDAQYTSQTLAQEKGPYPLAKGRWQRNVALLSIAPTGSISLIAGCSSGIEPYFRRSVTHTGAITTLRIDYPNSDKPWFRTASEVDPSWHVRHQAAWQQFMDNGVSKTVNMDNTMTPDDVRATYELAWSMRCKGITIFRDGSRDKQVYEAAKCIDGACEIAETPGIRHTHATLPPGKSGGTPDSGRLELATA
jgi:ribonucleoside-diphosphate reductase alpha chain